MKLAYIGTYPPLECGIGTFTKNPVHSMVSANDVTPKVCDGFEDYGVNRNQGAESSLAYLISHLTVLQAYDEFHKLD